MPDGSSVGTSGSTRIIVKPLSAVVCASRVKRAARNKKIFYFATDMHRHTQTGKLLIAGRLMSAYQIISPYGLSWI